MSRYSKKTISNLSRRNETKVVGQLSESHRCITCGETKAKNDFFPTYWKRYQYICRKCAKQKTRKWLRSLRIGVLKGYGGKCACCGFDDLDKKVRFKNRSISFLQLDHVMGGGSKDHKGSRKWALYMRIKKNNFPPGYRVLCIACNHAMEPGENVCEYHKWAKSVGSI